MTSLVSRLQAELSDWEKKERDAQARAWQAHQNVVATWQPQKDLKAKIAKLQEEEK